MLYLIYVHNSKCYEFSINIGGVGPYKERKTAKHHLQNELNISPRETHSQCLRNGVYSTTYAFSIQSNKINCPFDFLFRERNKQINRNRIFFILCLLHNLIFRYLKYKHRKREN